MYDHKVSLKFDFGFDRSCVTRVTAPYSAKYAVFEFVNTLEGTFLEQFQPNLHKMCMTIKSRSSSILGWIAHV